MKQSEFQQTVLTAIGKINIKIDEMDIEFKNFKTFIIEQRKFNEEQRKFNKSFSNRLDSIEKRLTKLESFHKDEL